MSERYTRVFSLPELLYAEGAPVIIMAGAILKDNKMGGVLAQLKIQSIADKTIKAATVRLSPFDTVNAPLGEDIDFQYLDLAAKRNHEFGEQTPIPLPLAETRAFSVAVTRVIFTDNTIWSDEGKPWEELPPFVSLNDSLKTYELVKQFEMTYGGSCLYQEEKDLWRCVCGNWNRKTDSTCFKCKSDATELSAFDFDELEAATEKRLAEEEAKRQRAIEAARKAKLENEERERKARLVAEEQARREAEQKVAKRKAAIRKAKKPVIAIMIIVVVGVLISIPVKKNLAYNDALAMVEAEKYFDAISVFEKLGDYKDSQEQIKDIQAKAEFQDFLTFKNVLDIHSPHWHYTSRLNEIFQTISYKYNDNTATMIFSLAKQNIDAEALKTAKFNADCLSKRMYKHSDNKERFDCIVLLYEDSNENNLLYSSLNGVATTKID